MTYHSVPMDPSILAWLVVHYDFSNTDHRDGEHEKGVRRHMWEALRTYPGLQEEWDLDPIYKVILDAPDPEIRHEAWNALMKRDFSICRLDYVIEKSPDKDIRREAWGVARMAYITHPKRPLNWAEKLSIICRAPDQEIRRGAWDMVQVQEKDANWFWQILNGILTESPDPEIRQEAWELRKEQLKKDVFSIEDIILQCPDKRIKQEAKGIERRRRGTLRQPFLQRFFRGVTRQ